MKLLIHADGNATIGSGHVMRCLALAAAWRRRGPVVWHAERTAPALASRIDDVAKRVHGAWEGVLAATGPDAVVIDGYDVAPEQVAAAKQAGCAVLRIDDRARTGPQGADILVDANFGAGPAPTAERHAGMPRPSKVLRGPRYAMLRPRQDDERPQAGDVLVTLGASAPPHVVRGVIEHVEQHAGPGTLVLGALQEDADALEAAASARHWRVARDVRDLRPWIEAHQRVVCAAGTTMMEIASIGRAAIATAFADNQRAPLQAAADMDLVAPVNDVDDHEAWNTAFRRLEGLDAREHMAALQRRLVDGNGARRVATHVAAACLRVRPAGDGDRDLVLAWANDPVTRAAGFHPEPITPEEHAAWWRRRGEDGSPRYLVTSREAATVAEEPLAFVWFRLEHDEATISINVAPGHRGQGVGPAAVRAAVDRLWSDASAVERVRALVNTTNEASRRAFLDADFDPLEATERDEAEAGGKRPWVFMARRGGP